ncbi:MAG: YeeE/YedE family protein [Rhodospirillales bacterium]|nr:YeeE/YedE family protein [Rhodospirillales bacterium]
MENFSPISALIGGALIGVSASLLLWLNGRIAGISGIAGGLLSPSKGEMTWRALFLIGLVGGVAIYRLAGGELQSIQINGSIPLLLIGGLLVGLGTGIGGGCTSGHGVCGMARLSPRSIVATVVFLGVAAGTVFVTRHLLGWGAMP